MKRFIRILGVGILSLALFTGCGGSHQGSTKIGHTEAETKPSDTDTAVDFADAESFESALNAGENLEGKVVTFVARELHPDSLKGYNVWAGEHLNFVSSRNPDIKAGDTVTVKANTIESFSGSWIIYYDKISVIPAADKPETAEGGEPETEPITETEAATADTSNDTYESNSYYDVVETGVFKNSIGSTIIVDKVLAKQTGGLEATIIAYAADGSVVGKSTSDIYVTKDKYNFFRFSFDADVSGATFDKTVKTYNSYLEGDVNAVEMVTYNQSEDDLYITFKQVSENLGSFAQFKLLFYKDNKIVDTEDGYFSIYAENLNGKDTTDVASIWVWGTDYDRIEYFFEP